LGAAVGAILVGFRLSRRGVRTAGDIAVDAAAFGDRIDRLRGR